MNNKPKLRDIFKHPDFKDIIMYSSLFLLICLWFVNFGFILIEGAINPIINEIMMFLSILCLFMVILGLKELERI